MCHSQPELSRKSFKNGSYFEIFFIKNATLENACCYSVTDSINTKTGLCTNFCECVYSKATFARPEKDREGIVSHWILYGF